MQFFLLGGGGGRTVLASYEPTDPSNTCKITGVGFHPQHITCIASMMADESHFYGLWGYHVVLCEGQS
jgi:hypothetical protein